MIMARILPVPLNGFSQSTGIPCQSINCRGLSVWLGATMRLVKKFIMAGALASLATVAAAGAAFAVPVGPCPSAAMSSYVVAGFTCTIGDKTFSDFTYTPAMAGTGTASPSTAVTVTPLGAPNYGFKFAGTWNSGTNGTGDAGIDLPPIHAPLAMLIRAVAEGRADRAVAPQQRRPDRPFPARLSPARAGGNRASYAVGPGCSFVSSARSALALPPR